MHRFLDPLVFGGRMRLQWWWRGSNPTTDLPLGTLPVFQRPVLWAAFFFIIPVRQGGDFDFLVKMPSHGGHGDMLFSHRMSLV